MEDAERELRVRAVERRESLPSRVLGLGTRGAQRAAELTGLDQALEQAAEDAIVSAAESAAFERALIRVLQGPAVREVSESVLQSAAVEQALREALDSEMVDRLWARFLDSEETQKLIERIAESPEIRGAIAAQGMGLIDDIGAQLAGVARGLDDLVERAAWWLLNRRRDASPPQAGVVTRALALAVDAAFVNIAFFLSSALAGLVVAGITDWGPPSDPLLALGASAWVGAGSVYLVAFWALAGKTPGMSFLDIRLDTAEGPRIGFRRAVRRLAGFALSVLTLGAGFLGILLGARRRGLADLFGGTEVVYDPGTTIGGGF